MKSVALVSVILLAFAAPVPASADDSGECSRRRACSLEGQSDVAWDMAFSDFMVTRVVTRMVLGELAAENRGEAHLGLGIRHDNLFSFDVTGGYAYSHGGPSPGNALVVGLWKDAWWGEKREYRLHLESLNRFGGRFRNDGLYQLDYWMTGVHVMNRGSDVAAGWQLGSGNAYDAVKMGIMISFGLTAGMPDYSGRWFVNFDFR